MSGNQNLISNCSFTLDAFSSLSINGSNNTVSNCRFTNTAHQTCAPTLFLGAPWFISRTPYYGSGNKVLSSTFVNTSYTGVHNAGQPYTHIDGNHLALGGRLCSDVSPIYSFLPTSAGTVISRNWVHHTQAQWNILGIRGDDKTRNLTVEHNVVWSCGTVGIVAKGAGNIVRHNTLLNNSRVVMAERPFQRSIEMASIHNAQDPTLPVQGIADVCANNLMEHGVTGDMVAGALPAGKLFGNYFSETSCAARQVPV